MGPDLCYYFAYLEHPPFHYSCLVGCYGLSLHQLEPWQRIFLQGWQYCLLAVHKADCQDTPLLTDIEFYIEIFRRF